MHQTWHWKTKSSLICLCSLLFLTLISGVANAATDAELLATIKQNTKMLVNPSIKFTVNGGAVTITGKIKTNSEAETLIATVASIRGVSSVTPNDLDLTNGADLSRQAVAVGLTKGRLVRSGLFGAGVTNPGMLPINVSYSVIRNTINTADGRQFNDEIIYLDGNVPNQYILEKSIIIAQNVAVMFFPPMRVISRMRIG